ncbi:MAG: MFS transporter, partial [Lysobacterales bacterium]
VMSTLARRPDASKGYGLLMTLQFLLSAVGLYGIPLLLPVTGVRGLFVGIGVIELVAAVTMGLISLAPVIGAQVTHAGTELKVLLNRVALFSIIGGGLYEASNTAQFTYAERMGVAINLGGDTIGPVLGTASLMGIPGALCIVWIGDRVRSITMVQLGIAGTLAGLLLLMVATNLTLYTISMCLLGFSWAFTLPYFQTIQAGMDPRGSVVAAGAFATMIGDTLAPGAAASVLSGDDYTRVLSLSIILSGLAAVLIRKKTS